MKQEDKNSSYAVKITFFKTKVSNVSEKSSFLLKHLSFNPIRFMELNKKIGNDKKIHRKRK